jgi:hypothetical protein
MAKTEGPFAELAALTSEHSDLVSRIAAPLWSRVGRSIDATDLAWARPLLGESGPQLLMLALREFSALDPRSGALSARGLSRIISALLDVAPTGDVRPQSPELVWTLPHSHSAHTVRGQTYSDCCLRLIHEASESLTLVSPFYRRRRNRPPFGPTPRGVGERRSRETVCARCVERGKPR